MPMRDGMGDGSVCQRQRLDVFWQFCLWLMSSSESILPQRRWSDGDKGDNPADRGFRAVISLILFLPGDGVMCVTITYFVPSLTLCVYLFVCLLACVPPGPFRQRTQLSMRMMCTGASRSSQSEYATKKKKQVCFAFLRKIVHVFKLNYLQTSPLHSPTLTFHWTLKLNPDLRLNMAYRFSIKVRLFNTTDTKWHQILFSVASLPRWSERNLYFYSKWSPILVSWYISMCHQHR